jgi:hypothetical protein
MRREIDTIPVRMGGSTRTRSRRTRGQRGLVGGRWLPRWEEGGGSRDDNGPDPLFAAGNSSLGDEDVEISFPAGM